MVNMDVFNGPVKSVLTKFYCNCILDVHNNFHYYLSWQFGADKINIVIKYAKRQHSLDNQVN